MNLFNYKTIVIASLVRNIMELNSIGFLEAKSLSSDFDGIDDLEQAVIFLDKRCHVYSRLDAAETVFDTILRTCGNGMGYFPDEYPVFAEANPEVDEHHEHFFTFWKDYTLHQAWHNLIDSVVLMMNGLYYTSSPDYIKDNSFLCIAYPGFESQYPEAALLIKQYEELKVKLGFDPCFDRLDNCKFTGSSSIMFSLDVEQEKNVPSVVCYLGRICLASRPNKGDLLGNRFMKAVD